MFHLVHKGKCLILAIHLCRDEWNISEVERTFLLYKVIIFGFSWRTVAWNQPMTWGDTGGQFYWNGSGGYLGIEAK